MKAKKVTLFAPIIIECFSKAMDLMIKHSADLDKTFWNKSLNWAGSGRDQDLSGAKQKLADKFKTKTLPAIDTTNLSDNALLITIGNQLELLRTAVIKKCNGFGHPDTTYGPKIDEAKNMGEYLYKKFAEHGLIDIEFDEKDPFCCQLYCAANYIGFKETQTKDGWFVWAKNHPSGGNGTELDRLRGILLKNTLFNTIDGIDGQDKNHPWYANRRLKEVLSHTEILRANNAELSKDSRFAVNLSIPVQLSVLTEARLMGKWHPSEGSLTGYMVESFYKMIQDILPHERTISVWTVAVPPVDPLPAPVLLAPPPRVTHKKDSKNSLFSPKKQATPQLPPLPSIVTTEIVSNLYGMLQNTPPLPASAKMPNPLDGIIFSMDELTQGNSLLPGMNLS